MLEGVFEYLNGRSPLQLVRDALDVFIVYYVFYRMLLVARGTRAMQVAAGLGMVALFYVMAQALELVTITTLLGSLLQSIILVIVVVFQNDIRRALQRVGSRAFFGGFGRGQESEVIEQVVEAARELAGHRIGAIITFEQDANLDEFIGQNKGIDLDARVSAELLVSLFIPEGSNKLHDGAVIIRNLRIAKAGVFYPMPENRTFDSSFGSRHRAALGITEETDAVVVVVSEERGNISFCFNGNIASDLQADQLREMLFSIMSPKVRKKSRQYRKSVPGDAPISSRLSAADRERISDVGSARASRRASSAGRPGAQEKGASRASSHGRPSADLAGAGALNERDLQEDAPAPLRKSRLPEQPKPVVPTAATSSGDAPPPALSSPSTPGSPTPPALLPTGTHPVEPESSSDGANPSVTTPRSADVTAPAPGVPATPPTATAAEESDDDSLKKIAVGPKSSRPMPKAQDVQIVRDPDAPDDNPRQSS